MPSLVYNYNNWQFWSVYDPANGLLGNQKVTFDGPNKIIIVNEGVTELDFKTDVYSAWKEWILDPTQINAKWVEAISVVGGDPLPGARQLGTTFFLENGWRMRTWEGNHELTVTGNAFTREGVSLFVPTLNPWTITINLNTSTLVETIIPTVSLTEADIAAVAAASATATAAEVPDAVWNTALQGSNTALDILLAIPDDIWDYIIDTNISISAKQKLAKIATKVQDLALG